MMSTKADGFYRFELKFHSVRRPMSREAAAAYRAAGRTVSRTARSSNPVRSMAYRSGSALSDALGETHDFTNRRRVVERSAIVAPPGGPAWVLDRQALWERVRLAEKRVDARWMQEAIANLPYGLDAAQRWRLATDFAKGTFVRQGMVVDYAVHRYGARVRPGDGNSDQQMAEWKGRGVPFLEEAHARMTDSAHVLVERNAGGKALGYLLQPHIHFAMPTRAIGMDGFGAKPEAWGERRRIREWRQLWQDNCNAALASAGREERVDCRSFKVQGKAKRPGRPEGQARRAKRPTPRMEATMRHNREVGVLNEALRLGMGIGLAVERGSLDLLAGEVVGETLGRAAAEHLVKPAVAAATRLLHPVTGR